MRRVNALPRRGAPAPKPTPPYQATFLLAVELRCDRRQPDRHGAEVGALGAEGSGPAMVAAKGSRMRQPVSLATSALARASARGRRYALP